MTSNLQPDDRVLIDFGPNVGRYLGIVIGIDGEKLSVLIGLKKAIVFRTQCRLVDRPG